MSKNPRISIIVPIYNGEKYLDRCINSVLKQTYIDYELILVNDGSNDKTEEICLKYVDKSPRIKYIFKQNGGQSSARNRGLKECKGEYVLFLDCDDSYQPNLCERVIGLVGYSTDIILYGFNIYQNGNLLRTPNPGTNMYVNNDEETFRKFEWLMASPCNKLYRREYITTNFDEKCIHSEDYIFNYSNFKSNTKIITISDCLYNVSLDNTLSVNKLYRGGRLRDTVRGVEVRQESTSFFKDKSYYLKKDKERILFTVMTACEKLKWKQVKEELNSLNCPVATRTLKMSLPLRADLRLTQFLLNCRLYHAVFLYCRILLIIKKLLRQIKQTKHG